MTTTLFTLALLGGCATDDSIDASLILLPPREQLIRLSVDLRGVHPTPAELAAIETSPDLYEDFVDRYLEDPRFVTRVREVVDERLLLTTGDTYGFEGVSAQDIAGEALALVGRIVEQDLSWSELVTADYTMGNPALATAFGLDYPLGGMGWQPAKYDDGRQHAGLLSMSSIWLRYPSAGGNANRHRANAVSKMFLCDDYLSRPVVLNRSAVDQLTIDPEDAVSTNEACQSCHSTLDPLAAHFFGYFGDDDDTMDAAVFYQPEVEEAWREYSGRSPAYYGVPTVNMAELGQAIASDGRFIDCGTQTFFEGFTQRTLVDADWTEFQAYRQAFVDGDLQVRPLVRVIVTSDTYKALSTTDEDLRERLATVRTASPTQLASIIEDITGYRWTFGGIDGLTEHDLGLPGLTGGVDGKFLTERSYEPGVGALFVQERLAWSAGWNVATHDLDPGRTDDAVLLGFVTIDDRPDSAADAFSGQIRSLYEAATGLPMESDDARIDSLVTLWRQVYSVDADPVVAWAAILTAVLRDPRVLTY
jgi:hypothetical protein